MTVPLTVGSCEATQPVVTVEAPQCVNGLALTATVTPVAVDGVTYDPPAGRAVDVELGEHVGGDGDVGSCGGGLGGAVGRWVGARSATEATFTVTSEMSADPCARVAPLAPVVTPATCARWGGDVGGVDAAGSCRGGLQLRSGRDGRGWWGGVVRHGRGDVGDGDGDVAVAEHQWLVAAVARWLGGRRR